MKLVIHADDLGLTKGINDTITESIDRGVVTSASIIPNGYALQQAVDTYERGDFDLSVHINLLEGKALSGAIPKITDQEGFFNRGYFDLIRLTGQRGDPSVRNAIRNEMKLQVELVKQILKPGKPLKIDSHRHTHMIPGIFKTLAELSKELQISYIRIPQDTYFFSPGKKAMTNLAKVWLLNRFAIKCRKMLPENIRTNDLFTGVLYSGNMNLSSLKAAIKKAGVKQDPKLMEALFHPGSALESERAYWKKYPAYAKFYYSKNRKMELDALCSDEMKTYIAEFK